LVIGQHGELNILDLRKKCLRLSGAASTRVARHGIGSMY